jgi:hypothetical protein
VSCAVLTNEKSCQVLIQLGVFEIPKAYIKKRWTRSARDILPEKIKGYQKETLCMQSMTFRHTFLYVNAIDVVQNGNKDLIAFDIASKYLKKAQKKLKEYFMLKEKNPRVEDQEELFMKGTYYTTENDSAVDSGCEIEGRKQNTFGASGSSAWMSDSELLRLKAPPSIRATGRPKEIRHKGTSDYYAKRQKRSRFDGKDGTEDSRAGPKTKKKKITRCSDCRILGHNASQCKKKHVDTSSELPHF